MRRFACFAVIMLVTLLPASASALTVRDVIELTRAGLGDEILLALIDVDPSVFPIDTATLKRLKEAGVSERVILAMVRSARTPAPQPTVDVPIAEAPPAPEPQVVVIEHHDEPQVREVPVPVPVYIPVPIRSVHRGSDYQRASVSQSSSESDRRSGETDSARDKESHKRAEPVYWGFGGNLRPDAWQPAPEGRKRR